MKLWIFDVYISDFSQRGFQGTATYECTHVEVHHIEAQSEKSSNSFRRSGTIMAVYEHTMLTGLVEEKIYRKSLF